ncbi:YbhB/YbcL family Raf kinase inhibitor-like protein [Eleftheria terrae]|uniref:YbhB/YbcL family Raf kinase inhibitor-like protein n=1 Tax=Eleftheria terrae TaxID=1597781 RepID=UPI00263AD8DF|nr:YbhB/YbcL family Raf kinase inhibitor-like protein [Eleftheria terrae]WKB53617.1 YbhB/YbcL family Raf kinase inhibitor-like protein [Eleftheria terrae]
MLEKLPEAVGHALREQRAGLAQLAMHRTGASRSATTLDVRSLAFADQESIPAEYTADGAGLSPPLQWTGVPASATSVVVLVEDADSPTPRPLVHAIAVGLEPGDGSLPAGALQRAPGTEPALHLGRNSYLQTGWLPPDPPPGHGQHRYAFQVFALAGAPDFSGKPGREEVLQAIEDSAVACGCLIGVYERPDGLQKVGSAGRAPDLPGGTA